MEEREEAVQQEVVRDGSGGLVLPDAGALHHVALLDFGCSSGSVVLLAFSLVASCSSELRFEVVLDLLLARLLLLLESGKVSLASVLFALFLLLGRLLLLLLVVSHDL